MHNRTHFLLILFIVVCISFFVTHAEKVYLVDGSTIQELDTESMITTIPQLASCNTDEHLIIALKHTPPKQTHYLSQTAWLNMMKTPETARKWIEQNISPVDGENPESIQIFTRIAETTDHYTLCQNVQTSDSSYTHPIECEKYKLLRAFLAGQLDYHSSRDNPIVHHSPPLSPLHSPHISDLHMPPSPASLVSEEDSCSSPSSPPTMRLDASYCLAAQAATGCFIDRLSSPSPTLLVQHIGPETRKIAECCGQFERPEPEKERVPLRTLLRLHMIPSIASLLQEALEQVEKVHVPEGIDPHIWKRIITTLGFTYNTLDVRGTQLTSSQLTHIINALPEIMQAHIEFVNISHNQLDTVPSEIVHLKNIKKLHAIDNQFSTLPESIVQLEHLEELYVDSTVEIPPGLRTEAKIIHSQGAQK